MKKPVIVLILLAAFLCLASAAAAELIPVTLADGACESASEGVVCEGSLVTITAPGEYLVTGALTNGQLRVDCPEEGRVTLHLQNVRIHNETGPAIQIGQVRPRLRIDLMSGTENELSGGANLIFEDADEPNGVIFSRSDLTLEGDGALRVTAGSMDGIVSKDDLRVEGGSIRVSAPRHGLRGKDCVEILAGDITIEAGKDGIRATNAKEPDRGYIALLGGAVHIRCGDDPLDFVTGLRFSGGTLEAQIGAGEAPED